MTGVPAQTGFAEGETETFTARIGLTTMVMVFDVAGLLKVQTVFDEVNLQETWSPDTGIYVYTELVALLALTAFTFHW